MTNKTLLRLSAAVAASAALLSCSKGWDAAEKTLINEEGPLMRVLTVDNPEDSLFLRKQTAEITPEMVATEEYRRLAEKMVATVTSPDQDGVGIAGPQVGVSRRVVAVQRFDIEGEPFIVYPNIRITAKRGLPECGPEGCLSVPGRSGMVMRSRDIDITYISPKTLKDTTETVQGFTAVILQHECDHLDGILYTDLLIEEE